MGSRYFEMEGDREQFSEQNKKEKLVKKRFLFFAAAVALAGGLVSGDAWASEADTCKQLVAYGREKVNSLEDEDLRAQVNNLLNQAEQQCNTGQAATGIVTAKNAIDMTAQTQ